MRGRFRHASNAEAVTVSQPPVLFSGRGRAADELPSVLPRAFVFDVEGTLIDNMLGTLQCWVETLAEVGITASVADLHPFSGMDGKNMLRHLLKKNDPKLLDHLVQLQSERYRLHYLERTRPFPGLRRLFTIIKQSEAKIALATSCDKDTLAHYRAIMNVDDLIDQTCCGDDVRHEKPSPEIVGLAVKKLHMPPAQIAMVGDTPYDAEAARAAGLLSIGLQSGHFSRSDLTDAGCMAVFFDLQSLAEKLEERVPPAVEADAVKAAPDAGEVAEVKSRIAEAADSH